MDKNRRHINDREPNFYDVNGRFFLVRCFNCEPRHGVENYAPAAASGQCVWCGWDINSVGIKENKK